MQSPETVHPPPHLSRSMFLLHRLLFLLFFIFGTVPPHSIYKLIRIYYDHKAKSPSL